MQEKRNIRLLILFGLLSVTTALVFWLGQRTSGFEVDKEIFRVADLETVDEVTMVSSEGKVVLKFDGTRWMANEYVADRNMIDVLFATIAQAEPKRPLANALRDSVRNTIQTNGVQVSLSSEGKVLKTFFAGGNPQKTQAYFLDQAGIPYYMLIPGYRVYVSGIFELKVNDWRDKYVFGFNWRNFKSMSVSFPDQPQQDFSISNQNNFFGVEGVETDTTRLNVFMDHVLPLTVDQYINETSQLEKRPRVNIKVVALGDKECTLSLFEIGENGQYEGLINGNSRATFAASKINPLLKGKDYFRLKESQ